MDKWGRKASAFPAVLILSAGFLVLAVFPDNRESELVAASMVMGLGNGLSAGLVMTLGSHISLSFSLSGYLLIMYVSCPNDI